MAMFAKLRATEINPITFSEPIDHAFVTDAMSDTNETDIYRYAPRKTPDGWVVLDAETGTVHAQCENEDDAIDACVALICTQTAAELRGTIEPSLNLVREPYLEDQAMANYAKRNQTGSGTDFTAKVSTVVQILEQYKSQQQETRR